MDNLFKANGIIPDGVAGRATEVERAHSLLFEVTACPPPSLTMEATGAAAQSDRHHRGKKSKNKRIRAAASAPAASRPGERPAEGT